MVQGRKGAVECRPLGQARYDRTGRLCSDLLAVVAEHHEDPQAWDAREDAKRLPGPVAVRFDGEQGLRSDASYAGGIRDDAVFAVADRLRVTCG